jgi:hypothetical protein
MQQKSSGITPENLEPSEGGEAAILLLSASRRNLNDRRDLRRPRRNARHTEHKRFRRA